MGELIGVEASGSRDHPTILSPAPSGLRFRERLQDVHLVFTRPAYRAGNLEGVHLSSPQEVTMTPYVRKCALAGFFALLTGFVSGYLAA